MGVDLAWGDRNRTGLAALDSSGALLEVTDRRTDDEIVEWLARHSGRSSLLAIDAPLIVKNPTGRRPCEAELSAVFGKYDAGTHPSNTAKPWFAAGTRGQRLAHRLGLDIDPQSVSLRRAIEVYPHPAIVVLFGLDRTIKYKHKRGRDLAALQSASGELIHLIESLETADPPMAVSACPEWIAIRDQVASATGKSQLRSVEDRIDAVVCAYVALFTATRPERTTVFGDGQSGYIITPTLPEDHPPPAGRSPGSNQATVPTESAVLERFSQLRQHQQDGRRSPHKPLLVLSALGRLAATGKSAVSFSEVEHQLALLISTFGRPSRTSPGNAAAYPFTRLRSDGVWQLDADVAMDNAGPLRERDVSGQFPPDLERALRASPRLVNRLARMLVESQFPSTLTTDVLLQVGLDPDEVLHEAEVPTDFGPIRRRSAAWVHDVLTAWDLQCAFCGYDGQLGGSAAGIEAAHVRWFNLDGPNDLDNGLALCALHHKLFDRGALGITAEYRLKVSGLFTGRTPAAQTVYDLHGVELNPRPGTSLPSAAHVQWHTREVFKGEALSA